MTRAGTPPRRSTRTPPTPASTPTPSPQPVEQLMTLAEAAERLAVSVRTLERLINRGELSIVRLGRGRGVRRIAATELARLITASGSSPS